jgi:hypothetical protein
MRLNTLNDYFLLKEAFYSCQLSGYNAEMTFEEYLDKIQDDIIKKPNKFNKSKEQIAKELEGNYKYIGDYYIPEIGFVCTVFGKLTSNSEELCTNYHYIYVENGRIYNSNWTKEEWLQLYKVRCDENKDN